ncbi:serine/threonine-protein kinase [Streptomyces dysideae]|uniref:Serine/threonine protein kinase n=1 Tax=Streptomyces dysideae TaxID=909626 RepID=A0A101UTE5_9ACTN|nr:serine/threonine-protein kinase [Streptomyces dysideae]KUO16540.1 serine/threonine protein kinase [Streptomyces dysideae]
MSEQPPVPPVSATSEAAALRQTGTSSLRANDPRHIGPYEALALLGSGGMGRVYLGRPTDGSSALVAVKVIRPEYADDPGFRRRFEREASVHAQVVTPHTPRLCGTGFQDELLWMATEYLPGLDLADAVREDGALATAAVWRLVAELGRALADFATAGIVHRDLKPSNVLLSVRGAHVIDFGLSKAVDASALTGTGNRVGTPAYMSPEHLRTGVCDTASDVFSLAGTLIYAATGRAPFGDGTGVDVMHRVAFEEPYPELLAEIAASDALLSSLLSACLAKEPEHRPAPQDLVDAADAHAGTSDWPEPLGGRVLARQRAYEVLCDLPAAPEAPLPSPGDRSKEVPPSPAAQVNRPARPDAEPPAGPSRPAEARTRGRRKPMLAVATGITLCAVAAGVFVLTRTDTPTTAAPPGPGATSDFGTEPGDAPSSPAPGVTDGASSWGKNADGSASHPEIPDSTDATVPDRQGTSSAPAATESGAPTTPTATPSSPPAEQPATPAWISDCTHYSGSGRTRQGDSGKRVLQVQCMLTKRGYGVGGSGVDGEFGPGTESAVRSFQSDRGLAADGIVANTTWAALRSTE